MVVEDAGGATSNRFGYRNNGTYRIQDADSGSVDIGAYAATAQVATWNYEGGVLSLYVDGVLQSPTPAFDMTAAVWAGVVVGGSPTATPRLNGRWSWAR